MDAEALNLKEEIIKKEQELKDLKNKQAQEFGDRSFIFKLPQDLLTKLKLLATQQNVSAAEYLRDKIEKARVQ